MHILISMDDTDNMESRGTGQLAQIFAEKIESPGLGNCSAITRHQLFVHEQIPYTSHNSAMCFEAHVEKNDIQQIVDMGAAFLEAECADGSDPGLCVALVNESLNKDRLIEFGLTAKKTILSKSDAYHLAHELNIHLTEHGGTGSGIIGALAGIGLRLSGNDGRFRGWLHFEDAGEAIATATFRAHPCIDDVKNDRGLSLPDKDPIMLGDEKVKILYKDWKQILLVHENSGNRRVANWITLTRKQVKEF